MKTWLLVLALLVCVSLPYSPAQTEAGEGGTPCPRDPYPWPESTPEEQGLDSQIFTRAIQEAGRLKHVDSLLVVRNGYLIAEAYFNGHKRSTPHIIASAAKTFISALVGIGVKENLFTLDDRMVDFFPEYVSENMDPRKNLITLRHLLTMTSGFSDRDQMMGSNRIKYAIEYVPLYGDPGTSWRYSTVGVHILSAIITKTSGMSTREFAEKYLFTPLQITIHDWSQDPQGIYSGGYGMQFVPRDMARFGQLFANQGRVGELQVIPQDYLMESWQYRPMPGHYWGSSDAVQEPGYGFLWRTGKMAGYHVYAATGHGGQHILVSPDLKMVIVMTGQVYGSGSLFHHLANFRLQSYQILSPVRNWLGEPPCSPSSAQGFKEVHSIWILKEYVNIISWQPQSRNQGLEIAGYRVYRIISPEEKILLHETDASTFTYKHSGPEVTRDSEHIYGITAFTTDQKESNPAYVMIYGADKQRQQ